MVQINPRQRCSNRAEYWKNQSTQCLDSATSLIWPLEWSLISSCQQHRERERESNCHGNRSPWARLYLNLLQVSKFSAVSVATGLSGSERTSSETSSGVQKFDSRVESERRTSLPLGAAHLCQSPGDVWPRTPEGYSSRMARHDDWPPCDKTRGRRRLWWTIRSSLSSAALLVSFLSTSSFSRRVSTLKFIN